MHVGEVVLALDGADLVVYEVAAGVEVAPLDLGDEVILAEEGVELDDLGDLRVFAGLEEIEGTGLTLAPLSDDSWTAGDTVALPADDRSPAQSRRIAVGKAAARFFAACTATDNDSRSPAVSSRLSSGSTGRHATATPDPWKNRSEIIGPLNNASNDTP